MRFRCFLLLLGLCSVLWLWAEKTLIYLEHCDNLQFDQQRMPDCQILSGQVRFRHDNALMFCDSAFFRNDNSFDAFGHIRMEQGDSIVVFGDVLHYNGDQRMARLRNHVRMLKGGMTLYTDSLNYDRAQNIGYYFHFGKIVDSTNVLTSESGTYYPDQDLAIFRQQVVLTNPQFLLHSDTLRYHTVSTVADIVGPSTITYDSTLIYSENGWYHTRQEKGELLKNSYLQDAAGRLMKGDTLYYDRHLHQADGYSHVSLLDSAQNLLLTGQIAHYNDSIQNGLITRRATLIHFDPENAKDSLFMAADTLFYHADSLYTHLWGNYNVQIWHPDVQGICDSVYYSTQDSLLRMLGNPVIWNQQNQILGDSIFLLTDSASVKEMRVHSNAFAFMENDSDAYNQMSGKTITGFVQEGRLHHIVVKGNARSIYFAQEEPAEGQAAPPADSVQYIGINRAESSEFTIYLDENNKVRRLVMCPASNGIMYEPKKISQKEITFLQGFLNCRTLRPANRNDIYLPKDKTVLKQEAATKPHRKRKER